jgi:hypothetical protein
VTGRRRAASRSLDHARVQIDTHHSPLRANTLRSEARDKPCPAGDIEYVLSRLERRHLNETTHPGFYDKFHIPLVELRRVLNCQRPSWLMIDPVRLHA